MNSLWVMLDACAALADQALDMIVLYEYASHENWDLFYISLGIILLPSSLLGVSGLVYDGCGKSNPYNKEYFVLCTNFLPGINLFVNALRMILHDFGLLFDDTGPYKATQRWFRKENYREEYIFARLLEAMFEAAPQTVLQAFVALRRPGGVRPGVLCASMVFSVLSVTKTLVSNLVFRKGEDSSEEPSPQPTDRQQVRLFLLGLSYEVCEVVSRVFGLALLGHFCGGRFVAAFLAGEYVLLFLVLAARGIVDACRRNRSDAACVLGTLGYPLLLMVTSLVCRDEFPFRMLFPFRLLVLGAYGAASVAMTDDGAELAGIAEAFFWVAVGAGGLWALLMPAFVNSCHNLGVSLYYTYPPSAPHRLTGKCPYPLEIGTRDDDGSSCNRLCGCIYSKKAAVVADGVTDAAEIVAGSC